MSRLGHTAQEIDEAILATNFRSLVFGTGDRPLVEIIEALDLATSEQLAPRRPRNRPRIVRTEVTAAWDSITSDYTHLFETGMESAGILARLQSGTMTEFSHRLSTQLGVPRVGLEQIVAIVDAEVDAGQEEWDVATDLSHHFGWEPGTYTVRDMNKQLGRRFREEPEYTAALGHSPLEV